MVWGGVIPPVDGSSQVRAGMGATSGDQVEEHGGASPLKNLGSSPRFKKGT